MEISKLSEMQLQLLFVLVGGLIGFLSSIGTILVSRIIEKQGRVKLYYKVVFFKGNGRYTWGFRRKLPETSFDVPLWIELQNTSNVVRIVRDFNVLLFYNGKEIGQMIQINRIGVDGKEEILGNEGGYSFVLSPRSIRKYDLHFSIKYAQLNASFNEIRLRYYDENDRQHIFPMKSIKACWEEGNLEREDGWELAQEHRKFRIKALRVRQNCGT